jgi:D-lactate dehydrogenase
VRFVNDVVDAEVIKTGRKWCGNYKRCAGFNNVDVVAAQKHIRVCRSDLFSEAVAEHAMAMILTLNRKTHKAYNRVREQNFSLKDFWF